MGGADSFFAPSKDKTSFPEIIGGFGTGMQLAGVLGATQGVYKKSKLEQTGYEFQSQVAKKNASLARQQGEDAILRGQRDEGVVRQKTAHLKGRQIAEMAARGLDLGVGSPLDILTGTDYMGERDALLVRDNANKEAWGYEVQATNFDDNARLLDWRASQQSPVSDAASTLLTGAGTVASSWYAMRNRTVGVTP